MKINSILGLAIAFLLASAGLRAEDKAPATGTKKAPVDAEQPAKKKIQNPADAPAQPAKKKVPAEPDQIAVKKKDPANTDKPLVKKEKNPGQGSAPDGFEQVRKADENNDGLVTLAEFEKALPAGKNPAKAAGWFKERDKNNDGMLSKEDFAPAPSKKKP